MRYDLIHSAVFVSIVLIVMLCEYLIKNWTSSRFAVGLFVHALYPSIRAARILTPDQQERKEMYCTLYKRS